MASEPCVVPFIVSWQLAGVSSLQGHTFHACFVCLHQHDQYSTYKANGQGAFIISPIFSYICQTYLLNTDDASLYYLPRRLHSTPMTRASGPVVGDLYYLGCLTSALLVAVYGGKSPVICDLRCWGHVCGLAPEGRWLPGPLQVSQIDFFTV